MLNKTVKNQDIYASTPLVQMIRSTLEPIAMCLACTILSLKLAMCIKHGTPQPNPFFIQSSESNLLIYVPLLNHVN